MKTVILRDLRQDSWITWIPIFSSYYQQLHHTPTSSAFLQESILPFSKLQSPAAAWLPSITNTELLRVSCQHPLAPQVVLFLSPLHPYCSWQERRLSSRSRHYTRVSMGIYSSSEIPLARQPFCQYSSSNTGAAQGPVVFEVTCWPAW